MYDAHDSVSIGSDEMSLVSNENSGAQSRDDNSASANDKLLVYIQIVVRQHEGTNRIII